MCADESEHLRRKDDESRRPPRAPEDVRRLIEEADRQRTEDVKRREEEYRRLLERQKDGEPRNQTAWLLIQYASTDLGIRPIPADQVFWDSPDIWVESSDPLGNPVASEPNFVHARVFNLGAFMASPVKVDFFWANPALGLGPSNMSLIGSQYVDVPPLTSVDVRCNTAWVPIIVNDGHECVMVNCSCWLLDPISHPFLPTLDRHVGQRNLHVVQSAAGQALKLSLQVTNVFPVTMPASIEVHFDHLTLINREAEIPPHMFGGLAATFAQQERVTAARLVGAFRRGSPAHKAAQRALVVERRASKERPRLFRRLGGQRTAAIVVSRFREECGAIQARGAGVHAGQLLAAIDAFGDDADLHRQRGVVLHELMLEPHTFRTLDAEVAVPPDAHSGDALIVHLSHQAGPITAGGYTIVIQIR